MTALSVISSTNRTGGTCQAASWLAIWSGRAGSSRQRVEMLTAIDRWWPVPLGGLAQRGVQHPSGERVDEPGPFGERDELPRAEQAVIGVLPAHQRLHAADLSRLEVGLGL